MIPATVQLAQPYDPRPGRYYVSVRSGNKYVLLYGPLDRHLDALAAVETVRTLAEQLDPRAWFYGFGTARLHDDAQAVPGSLNRLLPPLSAWGEAEGEEL